MVVEANKQQQRPYIFLISQATKMNAKSPQWGRRCSSSSSTCTLRRRPLALMLFGLIQTISPVIFVSGALIGGCITISQHTILLHFRYRLSLATNLLLLSSSIFIFVYTVRTPATKQYFNVYKQTMPADYNVVERGGWSALEERATCELAYTKMEAMRPYLASDFNVTRAGGWELLQQMAADPKGVLIQYIQHLSRSSNSNTNDKNNNNNNSRTIQLSRVKSVFDREDAVRPTPPDYLEGIRALLYAQGKGFDAQLVGTYTCTTAFLGKMRVWCMLLTPFLLWLLLPCFKQRVNGF
jgi:uncharacterized membrane-anchored protein YhcB (DUF1043 family)